MAKICAFGPMLFCINVDSPNEILKSSDNGHSWHLAARKSHEFFELHECGGEMLAITEKGLFYSKNGIAWSPRPSNFKGEFYDMIVVGNGIIALNTNLDTYISQNNGRTWAKK